MTLIYAFKEPDVVNHVAKISVEKVMFPLFVWLHAACTDKKIHHNRSSCSVATAKSVFCPMYTLLFQAASRIGSKYHIELPLYNSSTKRQKYL